MFVDRERITLSAAAMRFVLAVFSLVGLPSALPSMSAHLSVFVAYMLAACLFQWMIWKKIGGLARAMISGLVDVAMITFIVHRVGSGSTMMVALYFFAGMMNTLVVGRREGLVLAAIGALAYDALLVAESAGWLPYAPDGPSWIASAPDPIEAVGSGLMMTVMSLSLTALVGALVHQNARREQELIAANKKLQELSLRDPLTQLYNRRYLMERIEAELARVRRGKSLAVIMVDLDRFKRVNDDTGHQRGDVLLQELARGLARSVRETDVVGRYGGDEFVVILPDTDEAQGTNVANRVVEGIREVGTTFDPDRPVTASVGLAQARPNEDARALLQRADRASYDAKGRGGDRVARDSQAPATTEPVLEQHAP
ncbi:Diguanylate cyclase/phosphodiesterase (GGDEF & EAL domains) with PAS/PAC sensor(S) [Sandaracinus amylolyticus]|nr:Diguanylate cyclase/phosphodiesterase (GGDEF & EAL domains) with PAS/PAC sensor(S) [Sandaracinus amylolyticus]